MPDPRIIELRHYLRRNFPAAHRNAGLAAPASPPAPCPRNPAPAPCSLPAFPRAAISEIVAAGPACGTSLVLAALLARPLPAGLPLALIDARDSFDPDSFPAADCARLLWLRCHATDHALAAADLLVRDGNLPLVLLDLAALPARELRRIHHATWHRLRQLAADRGPTLLALTPAPTVPCAAHLQEVAEQMRWRRRVLAEVGLTAAMGLVVLLMLVGVLLPLTRLTTEVLLR